MMNLNKKQLKIISFDFRSIGNRLLRAPYLQIKPVLKMFITYTYNTSLIHDYINSCKREGFDVKKEVEEVYKGNGQFVFDLGTTSEEEIFSIYNILKYISENDIDFYYVARAYSNSRGTKTYDEIVRNFSDQISLILIQHISNYLTKIGIEMGYDEEVNYMITNNGGQVNISKDNSILNATQNIGASSHELIKLVETINSLIDETVPEEEKEIIIESVEAIKNELQSNEPKKGVIKSCIRGLKAATINIPVAIKLCDNIKQFIEFVSLQIS